MPEVGVLNLQIHDDSESASKGLNHLTDALVRIQTALGTGLNLSGVSKPLNTFAKSVSGNSKALANVGTFLNAMRDYHKAFKEVESVKFNAQPIEDIKKAIGEGIKIGQAGTQINKIKEALGGGWDTAQSANIKTVLQDISEGAKSFTGTSLSTVAKGISATAKALSEYADVTEPVKQAKQDLVDYQQVTDEFKNIQESTKVTFKEPLLPLNLQFFAGGGEFEQFKSQTKEITSGYREFIEQSSAISKANTSNMEFIAKPVEALPEMYKEMAQNLEIYKSGLFAVLPKVQEVSSEEMIMAVNARKAKEEIGDLIKTLESFGSPKGMALQGIVDAVTGVLRGSGNSIINESTSMFKPIEQAEETFQRFGIASEGTVRVFDSATNAYKEMYVNVKKVSDSASEASDNVDRMNKSIAEAVNLATVPASGKNGSFANVSDELKYLNEEFEKNKLSLTQWGDVYEKTQRQIKYNGATDERTSMLGRAEEGFYTAMENMEKYGASINDVMRYAKEYIENEQRMTAETKAHEESVRALADAHSEYLKAAQGSANSLAIKKIFEGLENVPDVKFADIVNSVNGICAMPKSAKESAGVFSELMDSMNASGGDHTGILGKIRDKYESLNKTIAESKLTINSVGDAFGSLGNGMKAMFPILTHLTQRFKGMAIMRTMRYLVRQISAGFREGVQNVYGYSKAIGGSFAPAMDSAATSLQQMKNSLGAALAPAIQAVIPYVNQLVSWFINLVNYVNQFFALLNGQQTWTRALPATVNAFDKQKKAAKGASAAMKDLLADWDELNIIQSQNNGSGVGSGKTAEDYLKMFEEVNRFDNKVKDITDFVKNNLGEFKDMIKDAGIALLAWKFSNAFTGPLAVVAGLAAAGKTLEITWKLTEMFDNEYMESGDPGWLVSDVLTNLIGNYWAGTIIETIIGGGSGMVQFGFGMEISAGITYGIALADEDSNNADMLKKISAIKATIGFAASAAGFAVATGSIGAGIGLAAMFGVPMFTLTAAVSTVVRQLKTAKKIAEEAFTKKHAGNITVAELYNELNDEFKKQSRGYSIVIDAMAEVPDLKVSLEDATSAILGFSAVVNGGDALTQEEADKFKNAWDTVFSAFKGITKDSFSSVFSALNLSLASENEEIRKQAKELRVSLLMLEKNTTQGVAEVQATMDELADKIALGKASSEEMAQYQQYIEALARVTNQSMSTLEKTIESGTGVDFNNIEEVNEFFDNVNKSAQETIDEINKGMEQGLAGIDEIRALTEFRKTVGLIGDEEYNAVMKMLDETQANITDEATDRKSKVDASIQKAYQLILSSALKGLDEIPVDKNGQRDYLAGAEYLLTYIMPIVDEVKKRGGEISEELAEAIGGIPVGDIWTEFVDALANDDISRLSIFQYLMDYWNDDDTKNRAKPKSTDPLDSVISDVEDYVADVKKNLDIIAENTFDDNYVPEIKMPEVVETSPVEVKPQFVVDESTIDEDLRNAIENALKDHTITVDERNALDFQFGASDVEKAIQAIQGEESALVKRAARLTASGGFNFSDTSYNSFAQNDGVIQTEAKDPQEEAQTVAAGVQRGNMDVANQIATCVSLLTQLLQKQWNINVTPNSNWGEHNARSNSAWNKMTGTVSLEE